MAKHETLAALHFLLSEKIYPLNPVLVRHDTRAASLVSAFIQEVDLETVDFLQKKWSMRSEYQYQYELWQTRDKIKPLIGLSNETIRKYISELWRTDWFEGRLVFDKVNTN